MGNYCSNAHNMMNDNDLAHGPIKKSDATLRKIEVENAALKASQREDMQLPLQEVADEQKEKRKPKAQIMSTHVCDFNVEPLEVGEDRQWTSIMYGNGDLYDGQVLASERREMRDGRGVFRCSNRQKHDNYEYHGEWRMNSRQGQGHCYYYNEDLYVGQWRADKRHGHGDYFGRKLDRYEGQWKNDLRDGTGKLTSQSGVAYKGKWYQDKKHGPGEMTNVDKVVYIEVWKLGVLIFRQLKGDDKLQTSMRMTLSRTTSTTQASAVKSSKQELRKPVTETEDDFVNRILIEKPMIEEWSQQDIKRWLDKSQLENSDALHAAFISNRVDGIRLLSLTESELKDQNTFGIVSLGRRKKIIRAINFLKASSCRGANHCASLLLPIPQATARTQRDLRMNRSQICRNSLDMSVLGTNAYFNPQSRRPTSFKRQDGNKLVKVSHNLQHSITTNIKLKRASSLRSTNKEKDAAPNFRNLTLPYDPEPETTTCDELNIAQSAGLIHSLNQNGFNIFIDYKELLRDHPTALLGRGGFGDVFKARWNGTKVAVKKFGKRRMTGKALQDFIKEIEMLNQLRHPNIVLYMGVSFDIHQHSCFYMVTEYVSQGSLFDMLHSRKQVLEPSRIIHIGKQMAIALRYLHNRQLFHCDLKSQNVLINLDWTVKLCDFGLSRYQAKFDAENHGKIGTPHWMAPEILRGEKYGKASDVYSFGVVLWEMLLSAIPFDGHSNAQITGMVGYHRDKLQVPSHYHAGLRQIVNNCLLHEAERRPTFENIVDYFKRIEISEERNSKKQKMVGERQLIDFLI